MRQADLNREVARATGETVTAVKRLGFLLDEPLGHADPEAESLGPQVIDWDELDSQRHAGMLRGEYDPAAA